MMPFPGMDPYLEAPDVWPDFHHRLATIMSEMLNDRLPRPYYARLEMRPEVGIVLQEGISGRHRIVPDVVVVETPERHRLRESPVGYAPVLEPRSEITPGHRLRLFDEPFRHAFVEIRDTSRGHKLVTLIEVVSPSNKQPGPDRRAYENQQREVLDSDANLIELDLLRSGERIFSSPQLAAAVARLGGDYLVIVNRSAQRQSAGQEFTVYPIGIRDTLPCIPVPLVGDTPDVPLDLQVGVNRAYVGGPYLRLIDYTAPPDPPLAEGDAKWADELLRNARLR